MIDHKCILCIKSHVNTSVQTYQLCMPIKRSNANYLRKYNNRVNSTSFSTALSAKLTFENAREGFCYLNFIKCSPFLFGSYKPDTDVIKNLTDKLIMYSAKKTWHY